MVHLVVSLQLQRLIQHLLALLGVKHTWLLLLHTKWHLLLNLLRVVLLLRLLLLLLLVGVAQCCSLLEAWACAHASEGAAGLCCEVLPALLLLAWRGRVVASHKHCSTA
jgi:hypothetical protein